MEGPHVPPDFRVHKFPILGSTNDEAKRLCEMGASAGTVVWALEQTQGRGRRRRTWQSPTGNLYFSIVERPSRPASEAMQLGFVASLAIAEALSEYLPPEAAVSCKWPNDVLVNGRKICGMLLESATGVDGRLSWLVVGVGVNVVWYPECTDLLYPATSMANEAACVVQTDKILGCVLRHYDQWRATWTDEGFGSVRRAWLSRAHGLGQAIVVRLDQLTLSGKFNDLDADGTLLLGTSQGVRRISAGDVFVGGSPNQ